MDEEIKINIPVLDEEVDMSDDLILDDKDLNEPTLDLTDVISQTQEIVLENTNE